MEPANNTFDEIVVGQSVSFSKKISAADVAAFATLTGDHNPLHVDAAFAKASKFNRQISHGLLVQSSLSTLAGMHLPGKHSLILEVKSQFKKPVFIDETVTIIGTVAKKQAVGKLLFIDAQIKNADGSIAVISQLIVGVLK